MTYTCLDCEHTKDVAVGYDATEHALYTRVVGVRYEDYSARGYKLLGCTSCDAEKEEDTASALPLFVISGFSASENGIMYNYLVNKAAIELFKEKTGKDVKFGVVVTTTNALGANANPLTADGNLAHGVNGFASDLTERGNDLYEIAVKGIGAEYGDVSVICCGYAIIDGEVLYMGEKSMSENHTAKCLNDFSDNVVAAAVEFGKENY